MQRWVHGAAVAAAVVAGGGSLRAMEFTAVGADSAGVMLGSDPVIIVGEGEIVAGDADRLRDLMARTGDGSRAGRAQSPELHLNSPGGNSWEGIELGRAIREQRLVTFVPEGAICASACTTAFLGGVERAVAGEYRIHAAAGDFGAGTPTAEELNAFQEGLQQLTVAYTAYAREMIGDSSVAEAALYFGLGGEKREAALVDDAALRDWNVITMALRPSQRLDDAGLRTLRCDSADVTVPQSVQRNFCFSLPLMRLDQRIGAALDALARRPEHDALMAEQDRWVAVRNRCDNRMSGFASPSKDAATELLGAMIGIDPETAAKDAEAVRSGAVPTVGDGGVQWSDAPAAQDGGAGAAALLDRTGRPLPGSDILREALARIDDLRNEALYATGDLGVRYCLTDVYERRVRQLEGLQAYYEDSRSYLGESWAE